MVYYGGLIAVVLSGWIFCKVKRAPFFDIIDVVAPCLALGHAIGRIGCLFAGCCYGKLCELPWAITFTHPRSLAPLNVKIHPTQLYEFLGNLIIVGILVWIERYPRSRGQLFSIYLLLYAILRGSVEIFRGDTERGFVEFNGLYPNEWLSTSTFISIAMIFVAALIYWTNRYAHRDQR
jgi:phosphatidylglycerol:prolipoprotein diacylglycerol transferase